MAALGIQVVATSALHPEGRGTIEKRVGIIKLLMRKMLAIRQDLNWEYIPYLISAILNNTVSGKTGFKPSNMVFGSNEGGPPFMKLECSTPPHVFVKNHKMHIDALTKEKNAMVQIATENIVQTTMIVNERANRNRKTSNLAPGDFVFVLDRTIIVGAPRPLKTKLNPSPFIVLRPLWSSCLVKRLSDGFTALYANQDLSV
jgi:hypothetical protein